MPPFNPSGNHRESPYLPGGEKRSTKAVVAPDTTDLSHMNPKFSQKLSRLARRGQKRRMKK